MQHARNIRMPPTQSPAELWRDIAREEGPLDQISIDGLRAALELALVEATIRREHVVLVPVAIARRMLADLRAQQRGKSLRPTNAPRKSWLQRRWEETAVRQFRARRSELGKTMSYHDALHQAAEEIAQNYPLKTGKPVRAGTIKDWDGHRGGRRRRK